MERDLKKVFGQALLATRDKKKLSQQELADYADLDRAHLASLERGKYAPSIATIYKLCEALDVTPIYFIKQMEAIRLKK
ncbi:MAG TPA: helix-turn-helix transcriptional regulator [Cyclobacteriaceae bacterium]|nr:helix-turn-helix transcriptional regulator [Cyclobacteriaceae bacterium]